MQPTLDVQMIAIECIDGKDDHFSMVVTTEQPVIFASGNTDGRTFIRELEHMGGVIVFSNQDGKLFVDATESAVPVKINGNLVSRQFLLPSDVLRIGNSIWKVVTKENGSGQQPKAPAGSIKSHFNNLIGLAELRDFRLKDIFSQVFKKHTLSEMEDQLVTGTQSNTPAITDIETSWAKPWLFSRMLLVSTAVTVLLIIGFRTFENPNLLPGLIFVGSFAVPFSTLIFFLEMNAPRNISIFMVIALAFIGGVTSLFLALVFFSRLGFMSTIMGTSAAGVIEEPAKVLIVVLALGKIKRFRWGLNGLLFGAAIGTGFAAFESAGYAFRPILDGGGFDSVVDSITLRGLLSPFMHIVWTANAAAALWLVKGERQFEWNMLADPKFLRVMISSVILHMTWNANFTLLSIPVFLDIKFPLLGILGWMICFRLVQTGLRQLNEARHAEIARLSAS
jgi:RsiW-degrading membrane proteinase PrsW (M82 family)